jgi:hypothetical protein
VISIAVVKLTHRVRVYTNDSNGKILEDRLEAGQWHYGGQEIAVGRIGSPLAACCNPSTEEVSTSSIVKCHSCHYTLWRRYTLFCRAKFYGISLLSWLSPLYYVLLSSSAFSMLFSLEYIIQGLNPQSRSTSIICPTETNYAK